MRFKTYFLAYCLVCIILSSMCMIMYLNAADQSPINCSSLVQDHIDKIAAFMDAREALERLSVAIAKSINQDVSPDYKELEDEYDSNPNGFFKNLMSLNKLNEGVSVHPKWIPIVTAYLINT